MQQALRGEVEIPQNSFEGLGAWLEVSETLPRVDCVEVIRQAETSELVAALEIGESDLGFQPGAEKAQRIGDSVTRPYRRDRG